MEEAQPAGGPSGQELVACTAGPVKSQPIQLEDAFEMGEAHLYLLALLPVDTQGFRLSCAVEHARCLPKAINDFIVPIAANQFVAANQPIRDGERQFIWV